jgi:hypothetical protein
MIDKVNGLLGKLQKVKSRGRDSWVACCPSHDDKSPSLKIDIKGGKILIKCWSGCGVEDILGAVGLDFSDIMPDNPVYQRSSGKKPTIYASDALRILKVEAMVITLCAIDIKQNKPINDEDHSRVILAMERINTMMEASEVTL